jgi:PKD repeat protein
MNKLFRVLILLGIFLGLGISCASAAHVVSFNPQTVEVKPGSSQSVQIVMDEVPSGLSGFNLTISISDPEIAEITAVSLPGWGQLPRNSAVPSSSVWIKTVDLENKVVSGNKNVLLGTITITGKKAGTTDLNIPAGFYDPDGDFSEHITPSVIKGSIKVLGNEPPVTDSESPVINYVKLSNSAPETGDSIVVTVDATDNVGVTGVKANDVTLIKQGGSIWKGSITALEGTHSVKVSAVDGAGNVAWDNSTSYTAVTPDNLPPSSITNLQSTKSTTWIKWTWQNPKDSDFKHTEVYLNGAYQTATSAEYFNATGLEPETSYTIGTRTVDINGNVNKAWVNQTVTTEKVIVPEIKYPVAKFATNVSEGYAPLTVQFKDNSENAISFNWEFGDGTTSTDKNPIHTYSTAGIYTVNLTVSNENGSDSKSATINVLEITPSVPPVADFTTNVSEGYAPLTVQFNDKSENTISFNWEFGDGTTSTDKNPIHTYSIAGIYTVNLTVSNENGSDSKLARINVSETNVSILPVADFITNVSEGYAPLTVQFNDKSENAVSFNWSFGDGAYSTERNPIHTYSTAGIYTVNLTVSNENGTDSKLTTINVSEKKVEEVCDDNKKDCKPGCENNKKDCKPGCEDAKKDCKPGCEDAKKDCKPGCENTKPACNKTKPTCNKTKPVCKVTEPTCKETKPICKETKPTCNKETKPVCKVTKPICNKETKIVSQKTEKVSEEAKPACKQAEVSGNAEKVSEEAKPACKQAQEASQNTEKVSEEAKPACKQTEETSQKTEKVSKEAKPACKQAEVSQKTEKVSEEAKSACKQAEVSGNAEKVSENTEETSQNTEEVSENTEETDQNTEKVSENTEETSQNTEEVSEEAKPARKQAEEASQKTEKVSENTEETGQKTEETGQKTEKVSEEAKSACKQAEVSGNAEKVSENTEETGQKTEKVSEEAKSACKQAEVSGNAEEVSENTEETGQNTEDVSEMKV